MQNDHSDELNSNIIPFQSYGTLYIFRCQNDVHERTFIVIEAPSNQTHKVITRVDYCPNTIYDPNSKQNDLPFCIDFSSKICRTNATKTALCQLVGNGATLLGKPIVLDKNEMDFLFLQLNNVDNIEYKPDINSNVNMSAQWVKTLLSTLRQSAGEKYNYQKKINIDAILAPSGHVTQFKTVEYEMTTQLLLNDFKTAINRLDAQGGYEFIRDSLNELETELGFLINENVKSKLYPFILRELTEFTMKLTETNIQSPGAPIIIIDRTDRFIAKLEDRIAFEETKKPIPKQLKVSIASFLGTILGFAIGGLIGFGLGAVPAAFVGSIIGGAIGGVSSSIFTFFKGHQAKSSWRDNMRPLYCTNYKMHELRDKSVNAHLLRTRHGK